jgi:hypothetical protein
MSFPEFPLLSARSSSAMQILVLCHLLEKSLQHDLADLGVMTTQEQAKPDMTNSASASLLIT